MHCSNYKPSLNPPNKQSTRTKTTPFTLFSSSPATMEREPLPPVRVRLWFSDRHLFSKSQREKGLRRSWAVLRPEIDTVGEFMEHVRRMFGLRCGSADELFFSMGGFVLPSFESTCMFRDKELIMVETSLSRKKKKIAITDGSQAKEKEKTEKQAIISIDNGENSTRQKKRKKESEKTEISKKILKLTPHEKPAVIDTGNNNRSSVTIASQNDGSDKNMEIVISHQIGPQAEGSNEKNLYGSTIGNSILGPLPSHLIPQGSGPSNWQAGQAKNNSNFERNNWKPKNNYNSQDGSNRRNNWQPWKESNNQNTTNNNSNINEEKSKGKNIVDNEEEEESDDDYELVLERFYPLVRLPKEGDIIAYRLMNNSSASLEILSSLRVGEVLIFDPMSMEIVLGSVSEYPIFPNGEIPKNSLYNEDGTLGIDFGALVDIRLVKEGELKLSSKSDYTKSGKVKSKDKDNKLKNANVNLDNNWEAETGNANKANSGGNENANSAWEVGEASNTQEESGWGTWAPSKKTTNTVRPHVQQYNNNGFLPRGGFSRRNTNIGGGSNQRNAGWETTQEAGNGNERAQTQTQENGWDTWAPSNSRFSGGQNGNFGPGGGFSYRGRGRNGRGGNYNKSRFGK